MSVFTDNLLGAEIEVRARQLLDRPRGVILRLVECDVGKPEKVAGRPPLITKIWQELDGLYDYIYVVTEDDPQAAFRLSPGGGLAVIPEKR